MGDKAILAILVAACVIVPGYFVLNPVKAPDISASVPFAPIKVKMEDETVLAYELEFNDFDKDGMSLSGVSVFCVENGTLMQTIEGAYLASTFHPRSLPAPTAEELWHGTPKLVHPRLSIFITVANASGLTGLRHELTFSWRGGNVQVDGPVVQCQQRTVAVIGTPMAGAGWLSMETSIPTSHHMLTQVTVNNVTRCVQRYAVDYMMMASDMSMFANDGSNNSDWYGYGKDLLAVADGVVTEVYGGVWENVPRHKNTNLTFEQAGGNMVIIDIGGGNYAQYAHLILGSATVQVGDHVSKGQIIGKLGNSGNSDAPHLHFQIGSDPHSILASEGYPFYYDRFDLDGTLITDQQTGPIEIVTYVPPVLWESSWFKNYQLTDFGQRILVGAL